MTLLVALLLAQSEAVPAPRSEVTIPLEEYERLHKLDQRPSVTVIDLLRVEGSFARRDLAVTFSGRASGTLPTAEVLTAGGLRLHSCEGDAFVSRADSGAFALTPLATRFRARCRLAVDGSDRLEAETTPAVLEVEAAVQDGELVAAPSGAGGRSFSVVRAIAGAKEDLPPSVAGRYRVTLLPEETRFVYRLDVHNPSRGHRRFTVTLRDTEHVESVDAPVAWDAGKGAYAFDLPPGETTLSLKGRITTASFVPPVKANVQYLIMETHPLIRLEVTTSAKRVGVGETGLSPDYRGAQAFLLDGEGEVAWTATRLEALKTAGLALDELEQVFFLGADGKARGEASFAIDNQGAPALALSSAGEPTFASVGSEPAFLTRDAEGRLFLPLAQGRQSVVVQDVRPFRQALGFAFARLHLPRAGVPASHARVQLRYPAEWKPLYEELAPSSRLHLFGARTIVLLAILAAALERLLALGGMTRRRRWILAGGMVALGALSERALAFGIVLALAPLLALGVVLIVRRLTGKVRVIALVITAAAVVVAIAVVGAMSLVEGLESGEIGSGPMNYVSKMKGETLGVGGGGLGAYGNVEPAPGELAATGTDKRPGYAGLPARIQIPWGARQTTFERDLLSTDAQRSVFVIAVASRFVAAAVTAAALAVLALALAMRQSLSAWARTFAARFRRAEAGGA